MANAITYKCESFAFFAYNANSYEFWVWDRYGHVVYQTADVIETNKVNNVWDGEGIASYGVYVSALILRNNCGERLLVNQDITVLRCTKSGKESIEELTNDEVEKAVKNTKDFVVYPNPSDGDVAIELYTDCLPYSITVYNDAGAKVLSEDKIDQIRHEISLKGNPASLYMIEINSEQKTFQQKIVINEK